MNLVVRPQRRIFDSEALRPKVDGPGVCCQDHQHQKVNIEGLPEAGERGAHLPEVATSEHRPLARQHSGRELPLSDIRSVSAQQRRQ